MIKNVPPAPDAMVAWAKERISAGEPFQAFQVDRLVARIEANESLRNKEATKSMIEAGVIALEQYQESVGSDQLIALIYQAMVAAAPNT